MRTSEKATTYKQLAMILCGLFMIWIIFNSVLWASLHAMPERGQFGDMFGAANSLFSCLAFGGVVFAIILQKREISIQVEAIRQQTEEIRLQRQDLTIQKEELRLSREELKNSVAAQTKSAETSERNTNLNFVLAHIANLEKANTNYQREIPELKASGHLDNAGYLKRVAIIRKIMDDNHKTVQRLNETFVASKVSEIMKSYGVKPPN